MEADLLIVLGLFVLVAVVWWLNKEPTDPPPMARPLTPHERQQLLAQKQAQARVRMKREGIRSILEGHAGGRTGWIPVKPMAATEPVPQNLIPMRRKK